MERDQRKDKCSGSPSEPTVARANNQLTGNVGLYYVCYRLSKLGWNVLPTSRNARGVDIVAYDQKGRRRHTIQVKTLSKRDPIPLGNDPSTLFADYLIICRKVITDKPELFIAKMSTAKRKAERHGEGLWIHISDYQRFETKLDALIGRG
ncbi:MAG: hypothetical protein ACLQEQ_07495 [Nitrososphaerales archaeon]